MSYFAMGIDVDTLVLHLSRQTPEIVQIVAADHNEGPLPRSGRRQKRFLFIEFFLLLLYFSVSRDDFGGYGNVSPAGRRCGFHCPLEAAAAGNLHAQDGDAADAVAPEDGGQLFAVVHAVRLWAGNEQDLAPEKVPVEVAVGIGGAVRCHQHIRVFKPGGLGGHQLQLYRPLPQLAGTGAMGSIRFRGQCSCTGSGAAQAGGCLFSLAFSTAASS